MENKLQPASTPSTTNLQMEKSGAAPTPSGGTPSRGGLCPAGFWIRLLAYTIDFLLMLCVILVSVWFILIDKPNLETLLPKIGVLFYCMIFILPTLEFLINKVLFTIKFGGSIGKLACGIKVVDEDGNLLKFWQAIFRYVVGYFVSGMLFGLGFLWILRDPQRQGWHDQVSGTYVVRKNRNHLLIGICLFFLLMLANVMLTAKTVQSIKQNMALQDDVQSLVEMIKGSLLEKDQTPATIEPQEAPNII